MNSGPYNSSMPAGKAPGGAATTAYSSVSSGGPQTVRSRPSVGPPSATQQGANSMVSGGVSIASGASAPSNAASSAVPSQASASQRSRSQSKTPLRPTLIIRPKIIGVPIEREPGVPTHTFISTTISLLLYLAVLIIILSVDCPRDRDVIYFFAFVLLAFAGSLFTLIINVTAVRYHKYNCISTSLSLLYSGSAALVLFGLVHSAIDGLCKPNDLPKGSLFTSQLLSNYCIWVMTALSVLWQLVAYYYYG